MDPATPFDWHRMFIGDEPPLYFLEIVFRVVAIYLFAAFLLRFMGKRGQRQLSPFEFVVIIALGSATGDAMFYPEVPILYAWAVIAVVVFLDRVLSHVQIRSQRANAVLGGTPRPLVWEGELLPDNLRQEHLRPDEVLGMLREHGIADTGGLRYAFLKRSGDVGFHRYAEGEQREGRSTFPIQLADDPPAASRRSTTSSR